MVVMASLAVARRSEAQTTPEAVRPAEMKAYVESIPGTSLKFDMLPIPGGTVACVDQLPAEFAAAILPFLRAATTASAS